MSKGATGKQVTAKNTEGKFFEKVSNRIKTQSGN